MKLPSVVSLKTYVKPSTHPAFTRFNVFLRDRFSCQFCGTRDDLTFDHLIPRSRGGHTTWSNVVAACSPCNLRKGNLTPDEARMFPSQMPFQPTVQHLHRNGRLFPPNYLHDSWLDHLCWDTDLDPLSASAVRAAALRHGNLSAPRPFKGCARRRMGLHA